MSDVTHHSDEAREGAPPGAAELAPLVYDELRRLAAARLKHEAPGQTLDATALVHEAFLRLLGDKAGGAGWDSRGHFFAAAAEAMRRILVENARRKQRQRHGGGLARVPLDDALQEVAADPRQGDVLAIDAALTKFAQIDPPKARLVELRYFAGLSLEEAARVLDISASTADRYWAFARAWLYRELADGR